MADDGVGDELLGLGEDLGADGARVGQEGLGVAVARLLHLGLVARRAVVLGRLQASPAKGGRCKIVTSCSVLVHICRHRLIKVN